MTGYTEDILEAGVGKQVNGMPHERITNTMRVLEKHQGKFVDFNSALAALPERLSNLPRWCMVVQPCANIFACTLFSGSFLWRVVRL